MPVACVHIPHFPVQAALRHHPHLRGWPVLLVYRRGSRSRVLDASPGAAGVVPGMPLLEALAHCPAASVLETDERSLGDTFEEVLGRLESCSPVVEDAGPGEAYVDLRGLEGLYSGEGALAAALLEAVPGPYTARIGVGPNKFVASVAADLAQDGGACRAPDDVAGFLRGQPVDLLPVSSDRVSRLHGFGLHTLGEVAEAGIGPMQAQFGHEGARAWHLSRGIDERPLVPRSREAVVTETVALPAPATTAEALLVAVELLALRAFARPELQGRAARELLLEGTAQDGQPWRRAVRGKDPAQSPEHALRLLRAVLEAVTLPGPLEEVSLTLTRLAGASGRQGSLLPDARRVEDLREAVRQLEARLGEPPPVYRIKEVEPWSRIPERRRALVRFDP